MKFFKYLLLLVAVISVGQITAMDRLKSLFGSSAEPVTSPATPLVPEMPQSASLATTKGTVLTAEDIFNVSQQIANVFERVALKQAEPIFKTLQQQIERGPFKDMAETYKEFGRKLERFISIRKDFVLLSTIRHYIFILSVYNINALNEFIAVLARNHIVINEKNPIEKLFEQAEKREDAAWEALAQDLFDNIAVGEDMRTKRLPEIWQQSLIDQIPIEKGFSERLVDFAASTNFRNAVVPIIKQANEFFGIPVPE